MTDKQECGHCPFKCESVAEMIEHVESEHCENFKNHPESITEVTGKKTDRASKWLPRDVLIDILRDIDSGKINPDTLVVAFRGVHSENGENLETSVHFRQSTSDTHLTVGMLVDVQRIMLK